MTTNAHHEGDDLMEASNGSGYIDRRGRRVPHRPLAQPLPKEMFRFIACPSIYSVEHGRIDAMRPAGGSISDLLKLIGWTREAAFARVTIDGVPVTDAVWETTYPRAGQAVIVRAIPRGGDQGKQTLRIVAMIGVVAASIAMPYGLAALGVGGLVTASGGLTALGAGVGAGTSIVGTTRTLSLLPPRREP